MEYQLPENAMALSSTYKSACGFGEPLSSARELEGATFCHYAVQSTEPLVIPDTAAKISLIRFDTVPPNSADLAELVRWQVRKSWDIELSMNIEPRLIGVGAAVALLGVVTWLVDAL